MHHDIVCKISGAGAPREFSILPPPPTLYSIFRSVVGFLIPFARSVSGRRSRSVSTKRNEFDCVDSSGSVWYPIPFFELTIPWTSLWRFNLSHRRRRVRRNETRALVLGGRSLVGFWSDTLYPGSIWSAILNYSISVDSRHCRTSRIDARSILIFLLVKRCSFRENPFVSERLSVHRTDLGSRRQRAPRADLPIDRLGQFRSVHRVARSIVQSGGKESFHQILIFFLVPSFVFVWLNPQSSDGKSMLRANSLIMNSATNPPRGESLDAIRARKLLFHVSSSYIISRNLVDWSTVYIVICEYFIAIWFHR